MNQSPQQKEDALSTSNSSVTENELVKEVIKEKPIKVEAPLMRYFDLVDDSSSSYVLGYN
jgi:hypothetical protein